MDWWRKAVERRAARALERQLEYQRLKAPRARGFEEKNIAVMAEHSQAVRAELHAVRPVRNEDRVLEVGSGAAGLIFFFGTHECVGVDPLADHYARFFPAWQTQVPTIAARGESLPFRDSSFDIVLCDNVVDHARSPRGIVAEIARVLRPGGILYFTVNVHHPVYHVAATAHAVWRGLGVPFEITPFADHVVHLTPGAAQSLFDGLPFGRIEETRNIEEARRRGREMAPRHLGDRLKRFFYKNATYKLVAERTND